MNIYFVGIKGTGMSHLARFLKKGGHNISGCDVIEDFFTAPLLTGIKIYSFSDHLPLNIDVVIYSSAYEHKNVTALLDANERGIKSYSYPEFLALLSKSSHTYGVSGTHGKTTTTAYATHILKSINFNGGSIYGSFLLNSDIYNNSGKNLLIEACEYKDHFNLYSLDGLVITNIEYDHPDYFSSLEDVKRAFHKRVLGINQNGFVICHKSIYSLVSSWLLERCDIKLIAYSDSTFKINGEGEYEISGINSEMSINIKADVVAALLISTLMLLKENNLEINCSNILEIVNSLKKYVLTLPTVASRSEVVAEKNNIKLICDYAHHPTEIKTCIDNIRKKYPSSRVVVVFMPHTASRTKALMNDFASSLALADCIFVQDVYSSARDDRSKENLSRVLVKNIEKKVFRSLYGKASQVVYLEDNDMASQIIAAALLSGDICITMGAGDNRKLIKRIVDFL